MQYTISVYDENSKCRVCGAHASEIHDDGCEVGALRKENARLSREVIRAHNDMMEIESRCLTKDREKAKSLEFVPILNIVSKWTDGS